VRTLEEEEYPNYYHKTLSEGEGGAARSEDEATAQPEMAESAAVPASPKEKHVTY